jgi:hypothetical protein
MVQQSIMSSCTEAAPSNIMLLQICRIHGASWCNDLPGDVVTDVMNRYQHSRESRHQQLRIPGCYAASTTMFCQPLEQVSRKEEGAPVVMIGTDSKASWPGPQCMQKGRYIPARWITVCVAPQEPLCIPGGSRTPFRSCAGASGGSRWLRSLGCRGPHHTICALPTSLTAQ